VSNSLVRKKNKPTFTLIYLLVAGVTAAGFGFWRNHVHPKTYSVWTEFDGVTYPERNTPIFHGPVKLGYVGDCKLLKGQSKVLIELQVYDGGFICRNDLIAFDEEQLNKLKIISTSCYSTDFSAALEGEFVNSCEIDFATFDESEFLKRIWEDDFRGLATTLQIDEVFRQ
jgi:hypothetical protein